MITVFRNYETVGTFGQMLLEDGFRLATVERPWIDNLPNVSCIPEGIYPMRKRRSPLIARTSKGKYTEGWEICEIPGRTLVEVHIANYPRDVKGCCGVGMKTGFISGERAVLKSAVAFDELMSRLEGRDEWFIEFKKAI